MFLQRHASLSTANEDHFSKEANFTKELTSRLHSLIHAIWVKVDCYKKSKDSLSLKDFLVFLKSVGESFHSITALLDGYVRALSRPYTLHRVAKFSTLPLTALSGLIGNLITKVLNPLLILYSSFLRDHQDQASSEEIADALGKNVLVFFKATLEIVHQNLLLEPRQSVSLNTEAEDIEESCSSHSLSFLFSSPNSSSCKRKGGGNLLYSTLKHGMSSPFASTLSSSNSHDLTMPKGGHYPLIVSSHAHGLGGSLFMSTFTSSPGELNSFTQPSSERKSWWRPGDAQMLTSSANVMPLLCERRVALWTLLDHISRVLMSNALFPLLGSVYLDLLVWVVQFEAYSRWVPAKEWIRPALEHFLVRLTALKNISGPQFSTKNLFVNRIDMEEERMLTMKVLRVLIMLPQFTSAFCYMASDSNPTKDPSESFLSEDLLAEQLLDRLAMLCSDSLKLTSTMAKSSFRMCLENLQLLAFQLYLAFSAEGKHCSFFSSQTSIALENLTRDLMTAVERRANYVPEPEIFSWCTLFLSLMLAKPFSRSIPADLAQSLKLNCLGRADTQHKEMCFTVPENEHLRCSSSSTTVVDEWVTNSFNSSQIRFLLFESIWPMIACSFHIPLQGSKHPYRIGLGFQFKTELIFPCSRLQKEMDAAALVFYASSICFLPYLESVVLHDIDDVKISKISEEKKAEKNNLWEASKPSYASKVQRLSFLSLPLEAPATWKHRSVVSLRGHSRITPPPHDERKQLWVASPVTHLLFHLYKQLYDEKSVLVVSVKRNGAVLDKLNGILSKKNMPFYFGGVEEVHGVAPNSMLRRDDVGRSTVEGDSNVSLWLHVLAQPSTLLHSSVEECDGLVKTLLPLWISCMRNVPGTNIASLIQIGCSSSNPGWSREKFSFSLASYESSNSCRIDPMYLCDQHLPPLTSLLWATWTSAVRRCSSSVRAQLVKFCISNLFPAYPATEAPKESVSVMCSALANYSPGQSTKEICSLSLNQGINSMNLLSTLASNSSNYQHLLYSNLLLPKYFSLLHTLCAQQLAASAQFTLSQLQIHDPLSQCNSSFFIDSSTFSSVRKEEHSGAEGSSKPHYRKVDNGGLYLRFIALLMDYLDCKEAPNSDQQSDGQHSVPSSNSNSPSQSFPTFTVPIILSMIEWLYKSSLLFVLPHYDSAQFIKKKQAAVEEDSRKTSFSSEVGTNGISLAANDENNCCEVSQEVGILFCTFLISHGPHSLFSSHRKEFYKTATIPDDEGTSSLGEEKCTLFDVGWETSLGSRLNAQKPADFPNFSHFAPPVHGAFSKMEISASVEEENEELLDYESTCFIHMMHSSESYILAVSCRLILSEACEEDRERSPSEVLRKRAYTLLQHLLSQSQTESRHLLTTVMPYSDTGDTQYFHSPIEPVRPFFLLPTALICAIAPHSVVISSPPDIQCCSSGFVAEKAENNELGVQLRLGLSLKGAEVTELMDRKSDGTLLEAHFFSGVPLAVKKSVLQSVCFAFLSLLQRYRKLDFQKTVETSDKGLKSSEAEKKELMDYLEWNTSGICLFHWLIRLQRIGLWKLFSFNSSRGSQVGDIVSKKLTEVLQRSNFSNALSSSSTNSLSFSSTAKRVEWMITAVQLVLSSLNHTEKGMGESTDENPFFGFPKAGCAWISFGVSLIYHCLFTLLQEGTILVSSTHSSAHLDVVKHISLLHPLFRALQRLFDDVGEMLTIPASVRVDASSETGNDQIFSAYIREIESKCYGTYFFTRLLSNLSHLTIGEHRNSSEICIPFYETGDAHTKNALTSFLLSMRSGWRCLSSIVFFLFASSDKQQRAEYEVLLQLSALVEKFLIAEGFIDEKYAKKEAVKLCRAAPVVGMTTEKLTVLKKAINSAISSENKSESGVRNSFFSSIILELLPLLDHLRCFLYYWEVESSVSVRNVKNGSSGGLNDAAHVTNYSHYRWLWFEFFLALAARTGGLALLKENPGSSPNEYFGLGGLLNVLERSIVLSSQYNGWVSHKKSFFQKELLFVPYEAIVILDGVIQRHFRISSAGSDVNPLKSLMNTEYNSFLHTFFSHSIQFAMLKALSTMLHWILVDCAATEDVLDSVGIISNTLLGNVKKDYVRCMCIFLYPSFPLSARLGAGVSLGKLFYTLVQQDNRRTLTKVLLCFVLNLLEELQSSFSSSKRGGNHSLTINGRSIVVPPPPSCSLSTTVLALGELAASVPTAASNVLYVLMKLWDCYDSDDREGFVQFLTRFSRKGRTPSSLCNRPRVIEKKNPDAVSLLLKDYLCLRMHNELLLLPVPAVSMWRRHTRSFLFRWLWESGKALDHFPFVLLGHRTIESLLLDGQLSFILTLSLLLGAKETLFSETSEETRANRLLSFSPSSLYELVALLYRTTLPFFSKEAEFSGASEKNLCQGDRKRENCFWKASTDLIPLLDLLPSVVAVLLALFVFCDSQESRLESYAPVQCHQLQQEIVLVLQWIDLLFREVSVTGPISVPAIVNCTCLPEFLLLHHGVLLMEIMRLFNPNRVEYFSLLLEGTLLSTFQEQTNSVESSENCALSDSLLLACTMLIPYIEWRGNSLIAMGEFQLMEKEKMLDEEEGATKELGRGSLGSSSPPVLRVSDTLSGTAEERNSCPGIGNSVKDSKARSPERDLDSLRDEVISRLIIFPLERSDCITEDAIGIASTGQSSLRPFLLLTHAFSAISSRWALFTTREGNCFASKSLFEGAGAKVDVAYYCRPEEVWNDCISSPNEEVALWMLNDVKQWCTLCTRLFTPHRFLYGDPKFYGLPSGAGVKGDWFESRPDQCNVVSTTVLRFILRRTADLLLSWLGKNLACLSLSEPSFEPTSSRQKLNIIAARGTAYFCEVFEMFVPFLVACDGSLSRSSVASSYSKSSEYCEVLHATASWELLSQLSSESVEVLQVVAIALRPSFFFDGFKLEKNTGASFISNSQDFLFAKVQQTLIRSWEKICQSVKKENGKAFSSINIPLELFHPDQLWSHVDELLQSYTKQTRLPLKTESIQKCTPEIIDVDASDEEDELVSESPQNSFHNAISVDFLPALSTSFLPSQDWQFIPGDLDLLQKLGISIRGLSKALGSLGLQATSSKSDGFYHIGRRVTCFLKDQAESLIRKEWFRYQVEVLEEASNFSSMAKFRLLNCARFALQCEALGSEVCRAIQMRGLQCWASVFLKNKQACAGQEKLKKPLCLYQLARQIHCRDIVSSTQNEEQGSLNSFQALEELFRVSLGYDVVEVCYSVFLAAFELSQLLHCGEGSKVFFDGQSLGKKTLSSFENLTFATLKILHIFSSIFVDLGVKEEIECGLEFVKDSFTTTGVIKSTYVSIACRGKSRETFPSRNWRWCIDSSVAQKELSNDVFLSVLSNIATRGEVLLLPSSSGAEKSYQAFYNGSNPLQHRWKVSNALKKDSSSQVLANFLSSRPWFSASPILVAFPRALVAFTLGNSDSNICRLLCIELKLRSSESAYQENCRGQSEKGAHFKNGENSIKSNEPNFAFASFLAAYTCRAPLHFFLNSLFPVAPSQSDLSPSRKVLSPFPSQNDASRIVLQSTLQYSSKIAEKEGSTGDKKEIEKWCSLILADENLKKKSFAHLLSAQTTQVDEESHFVCATTALDKRLITGYRVLLEHWNENVLHLQSAGCTDNNFLSLGTQHFIRSSILSSYSLALCANFLRSETVEICGSSPLSGFECDANTPPCSGTPSEALHDWLCNWAFEMGSKKNSFSNHSSASLSHRLAQITEKSLLLLSSYEVGLARPKCDESSSFLLGKTRKKQAKVASLSSVFPFFPLIDIEWDEIDAEKNPATAPEETLRPSKSCGARLHHHENKKAISTKAETTRRSHEEAVHCSISMVFSPPAQFLPNFQYPNAMFAFQSIIKDDPLLWAVFPFSEHEKASKNFLSLHGFDDEAFTSCISDKTLEIQSSLFNSSTPRAPLDEKASLLLRQLSIFLSSDSLRLENTTSSPSLWNLLEKKVANDDILDLSERTNATESLFLPLFLLAAIRSYDLEKFVLVRAAIPLLRMEVVESILRVAACSSVKQNKCHPVQDSEPLSCCGLNWEGQLCSFLPHVVSLFLVCLITGGEMDLSLGCSERCALALDQRQKGVLYSNFVRDCEHNDTISNLLYVQDCCKSAAQELYCSNDDTRTSILLLPVVWAFIMLSREEMNQPHSKSSLFSCEKELFQSKGSVASEKWSAALSDNVFDVFIDTSETNSENEGDEPLQKHIPFQSREPQSVLTTKLVYPKLIRLFLENITFSYSCKIMVTKACGLSFNTLFSDTESILFFSRRRKNERIPYFSISSCLSQLFASIPVPHSAKELYWPPKISPFRLACSALLLSTLTHYSSFYAILADFWMELSCESLCGTLTGVPSQPTEAAEYGLKNCPSFSSDLFPQKKGRVLFSERESPSSPAQSIRMTTRAQVAAQVHQKMHKNRDKQIASVSLSLNFFCKLLSCLLPGKYCGLLLPVSAAHLRCRKLKKKIASECLQEIILHKIDLKNPRDEVLIHSPFTLLLHLLTSGSTSTLVQQPIYGEGLLSRLPFLGDDLEEELNDLDFKECLEIISSIALAWEDRSSTSLLTFPGLITEQSGLTNHLLAIISRAEKEIELQKSFIHRSAPMTGKGISLIFNKHSSECSFPILKAKILIDGGFLFEAVNLLLNTLSFHQGYEEKESISFAYSNCRPRESSLRFSPLSFRSLLAEAAWRCGAWSDCVSLSSGESEEGKASFLWQHSFSRLSQEGERNTLLYNKLLSALTRSYHSRYEEISLHEHIFFSLNAVREYGLQFLSPLSLYSCKKGKQSGLDKIIFHSKELYSIALRLMSHEDGWLSGMCVLQIASDIRESAKIYEENISKRKSVEKAFEAIPMFLRELRGQTSALTSNSLHLCDDESAFSSTVEPNTHHFLKFGSRSAIGFLEEVRVQLCYLLTTTTAAQLSRREATEPGLMNSIGKFSVGNPTEKHERDLLLGEIWGTWGSVIEQYGSLLLSKGDAVNVQRWISQFIKVSAHLVPLFQQLKLQIRSFMSETTRASLILAQARTLHFLGWRREAIRFLEGAPFERRGASETHSEAFLENGYAALLSFPPYENSTIVKQLVQWELSRGEIPLRDLVGDEIFAKNAAQDASNSLQLAQIFHRLAKSITTRFQSSDFQQTLQSLNDSNSAKKHLEMQLSQDKKKLKRKRDIEGVNNANEASQLKLVEAIRSIERRLKFLVAEVQREENFLKRELRYYDLYREKAIEYYCNYVAFSVAKGSHLNGESQAKEFTSNCEENRESRNHHPVTIEGEICAVYALVDLWLRSEETAIMNLRHLLDSDGRLPNVSSRDGKSDTNGVNKYEGLEKAVGSVPTSAFLHVYPLLASQLGSHISVTLLESTILRVAGAYPHECIWTLLSLAHGDCVNVDDVNKFGNSNKCMPSMNTEESKQALFFFKDATHLDEERENLGLKEKKEFSVKASCATNSCKVNKARDILRNLIFFGAEKRSSGESGINHLGQQIYHMAILSCAYIELSFIPKPKSSSSLIAIPEAFHPFLCPKEGYSIMPSTFTSPIADSPFRSVECNDVPTQRKRELIHNLQLSASFWNSAFPRLMRYNNTYSTPAGITCPKMLTYHLSDGRVRKELLKSKDDLRQDATLQRFFQLTNILFSRSASSSFLSLCTYNVVPLTPTVGIIEIVENAPSIGNYLTGSGEEGAHHRYFPMEISSLECRQRLKQAANKPNELKRLYEAFSPAMHYFFYEHFASCSQWLAAQQNYGRSLAVTSMVGYVMGLGDRHASNILLHNGTGEIIHVDLGVAFDQGKFFQYPELVPFRLTRNMVDGLGVRGTSGYFLAACGRVMSILRAARPLLLLVVESILHDPLARWSFPKKEKQMIKKSVENSDASLGHAQLSLSRVADKLMGYSSTATMSDRHGEQLSVIAHVTQLVKEAQDIQNLAVMFPGWSPWL